MEEKMLVCKAIVGVAMSISIAVTAYKTEKPLCLLALLIVAIIMAN